MKKLLALVYLLVASSPAFGTDWYILDFGTQRCVKATDVAAAFGAPAFRSPLALRDYFRSNPEAQLLMGYKGVRVHTLAPGVLFVEVRLKGGNENYFSTYAACHAMKEAALEDGNMPNLNELK